MITKKNKENNQYRYSYGTAPYAPDTRNHHT